MSTIIFSMPAGGRLYSVMSGSGACAAALLVLGLGLLGCALYIVIQDPDGFKV